MGLEKRHELSALFAIILVGIMVRMLSARRVLVGDDVLFYGYDSFYHMRRILFTVDHFPHTLWFDSYLNYPYGHLLSWPPLFDQLVAGTALLLGADSQHSIELVGSMMAPILGTITIVALYFLAKEIFGMRVALLSALMLAISSRHVGKSCFGCVDHHVIEGLLMVTIILFLVLAISREKKRWFAILAGIFIAALAYSWYGAPAYLVFFLLYAAVQFTMDIKKDNSSKDLTAVLLVAFGTGLVLMAPFWSQNWMKISFFASAGILAGILLLYATSRIFVEKKIHWLIFPPTIIILGYASLILTYFLEGFIPSLPSVSRILTSGMNYVFAGSLISDVVTEAVPLLKAVNVISYLGFSIMLSLAGLGVLIHKHYYNGISRGQLLFLSWALFTFVLSIAQIRFLYMFSACMAILTACLFFGITDQLKATERFRPNSNSSNSNIPKLIPLVVLGILVFPSAADSLLIADEHPYIVGDWNQSLKWLEENTPDTNGFYDPENEPEYSVLSWWDFGNWILYKSQRPVVANNFQAGAVDSARFFLSENEDEALKVVNKRGFKYIITDSKMVYEILPTMARWLKEEPSSYVHITEERDSYIYEHSKKFMGTSLSGMHLMDGRGMGHFRLIHESNSTVGTMFPTHRVKIFEFVPGAKIMGTTQPDQPVGLTLNMTSNQDRRFQYFNYGAPEDGRYEITVPYSIEGKYETHAVEPYKVFSGGVLKFVNVSEEDILSGKEIVVNF